MKQLGELEEGVIGETFEFGRVGQFHWRRDCADRTLNSQIPAPDAQQQAVYDQGHEVGALARQLFPGGIEVAKGIDDFDEILSPVEDGLWDLIEVKSTTSVKDVHLYDLAFQAYVLAGAGLKLRRCIVAHVNPGFVRKGAIDPQEFFVLKDVTSQVSAICRDVETRLHDMFSTIRLR